MAQRREDHGAQRTLQRYATLSTRPLQILACLAPLALLYAYASFRWLTNGGQTEAILAEMMLADFFNLFGISGIHLPGTVLVAILCVMHLLRRDPWRVRPMVAGGMIAEAVVWSLPLLVLGQMMQQAGISLENTAHLADTATDTASTQRPWQARLTIAIGAGLYEELLFRMVGVAVAHTLLADLLRVPQRGAAAGAVVIAAAAFALYHEDHTHLPFYFLAGLYFGGLYAGRGFGVVVLTHAAYDVAALVLLC